MKTDGRPLQTLQVSSQTCALASYYQSKAIVLKNRSVGKLYVDKSHPRGYIDGACQGDDSNFIVITISHNKFFCWNKPRQVELETNLSNRILWFLGILIESQEPLIVLHRPLKLACLLLQNNRISRSDLTNNLTIHDPKFEGKMPFW